MSAKKLEPGSKWSHLDKDGDGVVSDDEIAMEERMIELEDMRSDMENEDKKQDAQRNMAWFALAGMLLYPFAVVISVWVGLDQAGKILGDMAAVYFVSVAAIVIVPAPLVMVTLLPSVSVAFSNVFPVLLPMSN